MAIQPVTSGNTALDTDLNQYRSHLQGASGSTEAYHFRSSGGADFIVTLSDAAGARKLSVRDSGGVEVASIDSDGKFTGDLALLTTAGDILFRNATNAARLGIGTAGQVLTVNSGATAPEWATLGGATYEEFTADGTWTKPADVTWVMVEVVSGGAGAGSNLTYWRGPIKMLAIWNRALTPTEMAAVTADPQGELFESGATALDATSVSFTLTANAATLPVGTEIDATADSFTLTENAAAINAATEIDATADSFTLTANAATIPTGTDIDATADSFTLTENAAAINAATDLTATSDSFTVTENAATVANLKLQLDLQGGSRTLVDTDTGTAVTQADVEYVVLSGAAGSRAIESQGTVDITAGTLDHLPVSGAAVSSTREVALIVNGTVRGIYPATVNNA